MWKTILIATSLVILFGCASYPRMRRDIVAWNGSSEKVAICKMPTEAVKKLLAENPDNDAFLINADQTVCIRADNPRFNRYGAMTFDDIGEINKYIEELRNSCRIWK